MYVVIVDGMMAGIKRLFCRRAPLTKNISLPEDSVKILTNLSFSL